MNRRYALLAVFALGAEPLAAIAAAPPQSGKVFRIAYIGNSSAKLESDLVSSFGAGLRELGYVEGHNLKINYLWAEGRYAQFPALVTEAIRLNVDVIVTAGTPATLAAKKLTSTIPIVAAVFADPVSVGIASSLAYPGGNITGSATMLHELAGKRLELLRAIQPDVSRIAVIWNPTNPANVSLIRELRAAAVALHITIDPLVDGGSDQDLDKNFASIVAARPQALIVEPDRSLLARRAKIVDFAAAHRFPAVYPYREYVERGGLASYAPSFPAMFRHAAVYVDKIFNGARPGDLPIEQPTKFEMVVNLKTARALGIALPQSVLLRADDVIH